MSKKFITSPSKKATSDNNLAVTHPDIVAQWSDRNPVSPSECTAGSKLRAWWVCDLGHEHDVVIKNKVLKKSGCPYCANRKVLVGFNDLGTTHPEIAKQLVDDKNHGITAQDVTFGSRKNLWWVCDNGHEFNTSVKRRTKGTGCLVCYRENRGIVEENNLFSLYPHLENEWDFEKNDISPYELSYGSEYKAWWKCKNGHSWKSVVYSRTTGGSKCKSCNKKGGTSIGEKDLSSLVSELLSENIEIGNRSVISPYELDMYIPDKGIAIEFNGLYWHSEQRGKDKSYHYNKWKMCKDAGIDLVTVWEDDWRDNRKVVETMLRSKLGVYDVNARDLTVVDVKTYREANMFFSTYDLYGSNIGNYTAALVDNAGRPVAMLSWYRLDNIIYVDKYASSCAVENGLSTLLDHVKKFAVVNGCEKIVGMSNNEYSVDDVYELCGFERVGDVDARCWEVYNNTRVLDGDDGGDNIWDCGRVRWEYAV